MNEKLVAKELLRIAKLLISEEFELIGDFGSGYKEADYKFEWVPVEKLSQTEYYPLSESKYYVEQPANPNAHTRPISVSEHYFIVNGNHRYEAYKAAWRKVIPALVRQHGSGHGRILNAIPSNVPTKRGPWKED